ncbi:MAG: ImmA/IrrE family metallo-endopeptidase [Lentimicrobiaceae bacterium]|nr:ImmA/IrrE family metallo-endopeptidase [Lentimicrobiaceae bacterium]
MRRANVRDAEVLAAKFRAENGFSCSEPLDTKTVLRKCNILTVYRPLSEKAYGMSLRSKSGDKFILINSTRTIGRQNFTIAHELYHLFYDENPKPHVCGMEADSQTEKKANMFASALLMPQESILQQISSKESVGNALSIATVLRLEQLYCVSRESMLYRLKTIGIIDEKKLQEFLKIPKIETAKEYGYETSLYLPGNTGLVIGNLGAMARELFEKGKISEGHYVELLNMIS